MTIVRPLQRFAYCCAKFFTSCRHLRFCAKRMCHHVSHMKTPQLSSRIVAFIVGLCLLPALASAQVPRFDSMYVFGDSLVDTGNVLVQSRIFRDNPPVPPSKSPHRTYYEGRFSNGYVAVEFLWESLSGHAPDSSRGLKTFLESPLIRSVGAVDFAYGGTGTPVLDQTPGGMWAPGLKGQVELFKLALLGRKPSSHSLYVVATGANDYRDDAFNVPMDPADVARNIEDAISNLYKLGARDVMVLNLPDLGLIPANMIDPEVSAAATEGSRLHNLALDAALSRLRSRYPKLHLIPINLDIPFNQLRATVLPPGQWPIPALETIVPGSSPCLFAAPVTCPDIPEEAFNVDLGFLFWDVVHPTTQAHRYLGQYLLDQLAQSYQ